MLPSWLVPFLDIYGRCASNGVFAAELEPYEAL